MLNSVYNDIDDGLFYPMLKIWAIVLNNDIEKSPNCGKMKGWECDQLIRILILKNTVLIQESFRYCELLYLSQ